MGLLYKPDWADAQKHFIAWSQGKSLGCPDLAICAPRDQPQPFSAAAGLAPHPSHPLFHEQQPTKIRLLYPSFYTHWDHGRKRC
jgi:hypothetical protein